MSTPLTSIGGLASGIDFPALTDAIIGSRLRPVRVLEQRIQGNQLRSDAYLSLSSRLQALQSASSSLANPTALTGMTAQVRTPGDGPAGFTVSAGREAAAGRVDVTVLAVAERERLGGGTFASRSEALGLEGTFVLNGAQVTVGPDDTLDQVVARINGTEDIGLRASVVTLSEGNLRLVLSQDATGADGIGFEDPDGVLRGLGVLDAGGAKADVLQAGADARLRVDGIEVSRPTNRIDDVIDGLTFTLLSADPSQRAEVEVARNTGGLEGAVRELVEAYNATIQFVRGQTRSSADARAPLAGDSVMRALGSSLQSAMLSIRGSGENGGPTRLSELGVTLQLDGTFRVDETRLAQAVASNPDAVADLFALRASSSDGAVEFVRATSDTRDGTWAVAITALPTAAEVVGSVIPDPLTGVTAEDRLRITSISDGRQVEIAFDEGMTAEALADRITLALVGAGIAGEAVVEGGALVLRQENTGSFTGFRILAEGNAAALSGIAPGEYRGTDVQGTINGEPATGRGRILSAGSAGEARGMSVRVTGMPEGGEAMVSLSRGIGAQLERIAAVANGTGDSSIGAVRDRLQEASNRLARRAEEIQARLELQREDLNRRFAAVEEAISRAQGQGISLGSQLDQISRFQYGPRRR